MNAKPTPEVCAVIAAAVYVTLGSQARIASVEPVHPVAKTAADPQMFAWSLEGRLEIQGGHRIR
jgi:hypothetical protein